MTNPLSVPTPRRTFLTSSAGLLGGAALAQCFWAAGTQAAEQQQPTGIVRPLHFAPQAEHVIFLCMAGGPSHLETFDYKPRLAQLNGKPMPESFTKGQPIAQLQGKKLTCLGPQHPFVRCGKSGLHISQVFRHLPQVAD